MKLSSKILMALGIILLGGIFLSNMILKQEYNKIDKNDAYWNYAKIATQHFKYLKINGGNVTNIIFEQGPDCAVRVSRNWRGLQDSVVKAVVRQDTLLITFDNSATANYNAMAMKFEDLVRISAPRLQYIEGYNTTLKMLKLKQKVINVRMAGKSQLTVESSLPVVDSLAVSAQNVAKINLSMYADNDSDQVQLIHIKWVNADIQDETTLNLQQAQIDSLTMQVGDRANVLLSGKMLKKFRQ